MYDKCLRLYDVCGVGSVCTLGILLMIVAQNSFYVFFVIIDTSLI